MASELDIEFSDSMLPGDWAPKISSFLGAKSYLNPEGGREIFEPNKFASLGIGLEFLSYDPISYDVFGYNFEPNLSVLDALMWSSPSYIKEKLNYASRVLSVN